MAVYKCKQYIKVVGVGVLHGTHSKIHTNSHTIVRTMYAIEGVFKLEPYDI